MRRAAGNATIDSKWGGYDEHEVKASHQVVHRYKAHSKDSPTWGSRHESTVDIKERSNPENISSEATSPEGVKKQTLKGKRKRYHIAKAACKRGRAILNRSLIRLRGSRRFEGRLLIQDGLSHDGILASHSPVQGSFHLRTQRQFAQVVALFRGRHEALLLKGFVLQSLKSVAEIVDFGQARVAAGQVS